MNWRVFYAVVMWTNRFWARGAAYTIVKNRHIGLDIGTGRRAVYVPALQGGRVVIRTKTKSMGWVVVLDTGLSGNRRYHAYCHLSAFDLPEQRAWIDRNQRVGRLASKGAWEVGYNDPEYGGTAWDGIHLHLVFSDISYGAYTLNTGASFANPEDFIREALSGQSAGSGSRPFEHEEDDMSQYAEQLTRIERIAQEAVTEARDAKRKAESAAAGIWDGGQNLIDGKVQRFRYGALPIAAHTQAVVAAQLAGLTAAVKQLAATGGGAVDLDVVQAAAAKGAEEALSKLVLRADS